MSSPCDWHVVDQFVVACCVLNFVRLKRSREMNSLMATGFLKEEDSLMCIRNGDGNDNGDCNDDNQD